MLGHLRIMLAVYFLAVQIEPSASYFDLIAQPMQSLGIAGGFLDEREAKYVFKNPADFRQDFKLAIERLNSLYNAPTVDAHLLFPIERTVVNELLQINLAYKHHLEALQLLYPHSGEIAQALEEMKLLYLAWDYLRDAKCEYYYSHVRRQALAKLQKLIGPEAFNRGEMPWVVPENYRTTGESVKNYK